MIHFQEPFLVAIQNKTEYFRDARKNGELFLKKINKKTQ